MNTRRTFASIASLAILAGCASKAAETSAAPAPAGSAAVKSVGPAGAWSGSFQPKTASSSALGPMNSQRNFGQASIINLNGEMNRYRVRISINTTENQSTQALAWSIYPGRCGSGTSLAAPVVNPSSLPRIDLRDGRGQIDTEVSMQLDRSNSYSISMFRESPSADQSKVISCANLRPE